MGRLSSRLWVGGTTSLISFIGFSSQLFIILPTSTSSSSLLRLLGPFNILLGLVFWNYYLCLTTDPGGVPNNWEPEYKEGEVKRLTGGPRFCRTCRGYKPPRAHHCRKCRRCVLKMDHHCPWVDNCVGHANYGHFIRFLCAVDVACSYHLWMITSRAFGARAFMSEPSVTQVVMLILNYAACVPVLIAVGMFTLYHLWSLAMNTTTIEGWEKDKVAILKRRGRIREYKYPYHLGVVANITSVLGENPLFWCWPQKMGGSGLRYPVAQDLDPSSQYTWPPRDEFCQPERAASHTATGSPFTYGTSLNPSLRHRAHAPYLHSSDSEADVPLGRIAARRARTNGPSVALERVEVDEQVKVRVRRGSEGFEVRPANLGSSEGWEGSSEEWERVSEGELDEDGDRRWVGERYKRYEAVASSSDEGSTDSMDEYLDD